MKKTIKNQESRPSIQLGMHADNWRVLSGNLKQAVDSAVENKLDKIEFGLIDGQYFVGGLGYEPSFPMDGDEKKLKKMLDNHGLQVSQIDGAFPLTGREGGVFGVQYVWRAIRTAYLIGCPYVVSTDGGTKPEGWSDEETIRQWKHNIRLVLERAESFGVGVNLEPHGPFSNNIELLVSILEEFDSEWLGVNFDTGNALIAGNDPLTFIKAIRPWLKHVHCKDVPWEMFNEKAGEDTGIASSGVAVGKGANADHIASCIDFLYETGWQGVFSIETVGTPENIRESAEWLRYIISEKDAEVVL